MVIQVTRRKAKYALRKTTSMDHLLEHFLLGLTISFILPPDFVLHGKCCLRVSVLRQSGGREVG